MLGALGLGPGERVIDIGTGPGLLAAEIAAAVGPDGLVCGIDISNSDGYLAIRPMLPELQGDRVAEPAIANEYSSGDDVMAPEAAAELLRAHRLMVDDVEGAIDEVLR